MSTDRQLRLGVFTTASVVSLAEGTGAFRDRGLDVVVEEVKGSGAQMRGLAEGTLDVVHTSPDNIMNARHDGDDVVVVFVLDTGLPQLLVGRPGLPGWDGVSGGVVGVDDPSSGFAFVVYELLDAHGIGVDDCTVRSVGSSRQRLDSLRDGTIDVGLLSAAMSGRIDEWGLVPLAPAAEVVPWYPGVAVATTRRVVDDMPDLVGSYVGALHDTARWAARADDADSVAQVLADRTGSSVADAAAVLRREADARTALLPDSATAADSIARVAALRAKYTGIEVSGAFDDRWMRELDDRGPQ